MKLIIWSFGTSDLKLNGELIKPNFYEKTKEIAEKFDEYKDKISFDMFESFLREINLGNDVIIKGIFTNQDGYQQDTIYLKDILIKYLKYKQIAKYAKEHIILNEARRIEEVKNKLDNAISNINQDIFDKIFIVPTGGTKGMTTGLILSSLSNLDLSKVIIYYGEEQANGKKTIWLKQDDIIYSQYAYNIKKLTKYENYKAIIDIIEKNNLKDRFKKEYNLAKYFYARLNADYGTAEKIYKEAKLNFKLYISTDTMEVVEESINGIIYTWRTGRYIEFLGRVYNFTDIATSYIIKKYYNLDDDLKYTKLKELSEEDNNLKQFLDNYKIYVNGEEKKLQWDNEVEPFLKGYVNTKVSIALLSYISQTKKEYEKYVSFFNKIEKLNQYRNNTIIGHGIKPVSKEIIEEMYDGDIEKDFKEFFKTIFPDKLLWIDLNK